jgi:hypothetical protein
MEEEMMRERERGREDIVGNTMSESLRSFSVDPPALPDDASLRSSCRDKLLAQIAIPAGCTKLIILMIGNSLFCCFEMKINFRLFYFTGPRYLSNHARTSLMYSVLGGM